MQEEAAAAQPPVARLYKHALESIFAFLDLKGLSRVLAVSRLWSSAVSSMRAIDGSCSTPALLGLCASRLARHVVALGSVHRPVHASSDTFYAVSKRLRRLSSLYCEQQYPMGLPLLFPPTLTQLHLNSCASSVVAEVARISSLRSLTLHVGSRETSLAPLVGLSQLQELELPEFDEWHLDSDQIEDLRELPHLTAVKFLLNEKELPKLLRSPHELEWQRLHLFKPSTTAAELLASLPSVTHLLAADAEDLQFVQHAPNLRSLELTKYLQHWTPLSDPEELIAGVSPCAQLTSLRISKRPFNSSCMRAIVSLMPMLSKLQLSLTMHFLIIVESISQI